MDICVKIADALGGFKAKAGPSTFWPAFWLAVLLVGAKAFYLLRLSDAPPSGAGAFLASLSAISHLDVVFAAAVGFLHHLALRLPGGPPRRRAVHRVFCGLCLLAVAYGVANLEIFGFFLTPLTYPLFSLAGDFGSLLSSVGAFIDFPLLAGGVAAAAVFSWLLPASERLARRAAPAKLAVFQLAAAGVALGWTAAGNHELGAAWGARTDRRIAENPHWAFLASTLGAAAGESPVALAEPIKPSDLEEFRTVGERTGKSAKASMLERVSLGPVGSIRQGTVRNVILLVLESLSARSLEIYGSPYPAMPNLTREADRALVFDNFYSTAARSSDSLAAILLSIQPRMSWRDITSDFPRLPGTALPELLKERGYRTAFLTSSDLGWAGWRDFLGKRGFDSVREQGDLGCGEPLSSWGVEDRCLVEGMIRWIGKDPPRPFFLMGWTVQTHHPYEPTPGAPMVDFFRGRDLPPDDYDLGRYLNVLHETDRHLGRLFAELRRSGLDESTLVVLVGDHGESFGQPHATYGHGTAIYEENVRVPMMVWSPRLFPRGARSPIIGSHVDLNQTLGEFLGVPPAETWQGRSLFDPARAPRAYFFAANDGALLGVRDQRWKYILDAATGHEQLYDLRADPDEKVNRAKQRSEVSRRLRQRVAARLEADRRFYARLE